MSEEPLFHTRERKLDYPVFDVDNHMYENTDALTKFQGLIGWKARDAMLAYRAHPEVESPAERKMYMTR